MVPTHLKRMLYFVDRPLQKTADGILGTSSTASAANECVVEPPHSERWEITLCSRTFSLCQIFGHVEAVMRLDC